MEQVKQKEIIEKTSNRYWEDNRMCFACGERNPIGLQMKFELNGETGLRSEFLAKEVFQSYKGIVHGGIIGLVLDETIANLPIVRYNQPVVTAKLELRLHHPAPIEKKLIITADFDGKQHGRLMSISGQVRLEDGTLLASAYAKCMKVELKNNQD